MAKPPLVSIVALSYNQKDYIAQALDSMLEQKCDFAFEILIHDDCSTDGTVDILRDYAKRHPSVVKPTFETENQFAKDNFSFIKALFVQAKGKYIAVCEGDDYWTDPEKLQLQVDYLEKHPDAALVFHPVTVVYEGSEKEDEVFPDPADHEKFTLGELLKRNYIQTNAVMYRKQDYTDLKTNIMPNDWYLLAYHAQFGKIGFIDRVMAAYRRHGGSMWEQARKDIDSIWKKYGLTHLNLYEELLRIHGDKETHRTAIAKNINEILATLIRIDSDEGLDLVTRAAAAHPALVASYLIALSRELGQTKHEAVEFGRRAREQEELVIELSHQLNRIRGSKVWRARNAAARIARRPEL